MFRIYEVIYFLSLCQVVILVMRFGGNLKCNFGKLYFYSRNDLINDFFSFVGGGVFDYVTLWSL